MLSAIEQVLADALETGGCRIGQIVIRKSDQGFVLMHRDDSSKGGPRNTGGGLETAAPWEAFRSADDAIEIARYDDIGNYRPLKTAPNLRHNWRLEGVDLNELRRALDYFYSGLLGVLAAWEENRLTTAPLRETLNRQSGMYRVAAKISDAQIDGVVGNFCRSDGGCLRTILWKRDRGGAESSTSLPPEKFDPAHDQSGHGESAIPLLCQEACNLLVNECRKVVKGEANK